MAGAQVRATAAALDEGALDRSRRSPAAHGGRWRAGAPPAGRDRADRASAAGGRADRACAAVPPWIGPLDVVVVAGDDAGDPRWSMPRRPAVPRGAPGRRRRARRGTAARGRRWSGGGGVAAAVRCPTSTGFPLPGRGSRGSACGRSGPAPDLAAMADELDAEALRNSPATSCSTTPPSHWPSGCGSRLVLAGDTAAELASRGTARDLLRIAHRPVGRGRPRRRCGAAHGIRRRLRADYDPIFHDDEIDGPPPRPVRVMC